MQQNYCHILSTRGMIYVISFHDKKHILLTFPEENAEILQKVLSGNSPDSDSYTEKNSKINSCNIPS